MEDIASLERQLRRIDADGPRLFQTQVRMCEARALLLDRLRMARTALSRPYAKKKVKRDYPPR